MKDKKREQIHEKRTSIAGKKIIILRTTVIFVCCVSILSLDLSISEAELVESQKVQQIPFLVSKIIILLLLSGFI